jgi:hypothetical protein
MILNLPEKRFPMFDCLPEKRFKFCPLFAPDRNVIIGSQETGFKFPVGSDAEPVAVSTKLGVVQRSHNLNLGTTNAIFFPVMHSSGEDLACA